MSTSFCVKTQATQPTHKQLSLMGLQPIFDC